MIDVKKTPTDILIAVNAGCIAHFFYNTLFQRAKENHRQYAPNKLLETYRLMINEQQVYMEQYQDKFLVNYYNIFMREYAKAQSKFDMDGIYVYLDFIKKLSGSMLPPAMRNINDVQRENIVYMCLKNVFSETSKLFMEEITEEKLNNRSGRELTQLHAQVDNIFNVERNRIFNKYINPNPKPAREHDVEALKQQLQKTTSELHKYKSKHSSDTSQAEYEAKIRMLTEKNNQYEEKLQKYDKIVRVMLNKIKNLSIQQLQKESELKPETKLEPETEPEPEEIEPNIVEPNVELTPVKLEELEQNELSDIEEEDSLEEGDLVIKRV